MYVYLQHLMQRAYVGQHLLVCLLLLCLQFILLHISLRVALLRLCETFFSGCESPSSFSFTSFTHYLPFLLPLPCREPAPVKAIDTDQCLGLCCG